MDGRGPGWLDEKVSALSRAADRDSLFMQAKLDLRDGSDAITVRVRNLSPGGMLAETTMRVAESTVIEIALPNVGAIPGRVVWVGEGKFGIAFDRPVNPQKVRRQVVQQSDLPPHLRRTGLEKPHFYRPR